MTFTQINVSQARQYVPFGPNPLSLLLSKKTTQGTLKQVNIQASESDLFSQRHLLKGQCFQGFNLDLIQKNEQP